jgi:hypothetical protein
MTTRSRLTVGAAVLTVIAGGGMVTRTVASAASDQPQAAACTQGQNGAGGQAAPAAAPAAATDQASSSRRRARHRAQRLSPGARWLQQRGEMVDRHGVHIIWGDGQAAPAPEQPATQPTPVAASPAPAAPDANCDPAAPASSPVASPADSPAASPDDVSVAPPADSPAPSPADSPADSPAPTPADSPAASPPASPAPAPPLEILGNSCKSSSKAAHTGFQDGDRCVSTEFGEVGTADKNPSLLITSAPDEVRVNEFFDLKVSTRNLVRDRFLKAAQGGYYLESSFLTADGLVRGHFHTACRMLASTDEAPDPAPVPAFFVATEDGKGGADPDTVTIRVLGMPQAGLAQCAVWAGDGSHRIPMMQRANQIPAFDSVRIRVS